MSFFEKRHSVFLIKHHAINNVPRLDLLERFPTVIIKIQLIPFAAPRYSIVSDKLSLSGYLTARLKSVTVTVAYSSLSYSN